MPDTAKQAPEPEEVISDEALAAYVPEEPEEDED